MAEKFVQQITGIYLGDRGDDFKSLITGLLKKGNIKQKYVDLLTSPENMEIYGNAFTSSLVDSKHNYEVLEQIGDLIGNQFIVWYIYRRFPQLKCAAGVKVAARLRINYGSKSSFFGIAEQYGFWPFISATNDLRQRKKKDLLEDVLEAFLGATGIIMDDQVHQGLGYATAYKILAAIFDDFPISLRYEDLYDAKTRLKELFDLHGEKLGPLSYEEKKEETENGVLTTSYVYRLDGAKYDVRQDGTVNMNKIRGRYTKLLIGTGVASLKADAQQNAAADALKNLAENGYIKHAPAIYAKFAGNVQKTTTTQKDVLRICGEPSQINEPFFTRGKSKYQSKYMSTALIHYCRERDLEGIRLCMKMGAKPNIADTEGLSALDVLMIGSVDQKFVHSAVILFGKTTLDIHSNVYEHYYCKYLEEDFFAELAQQLNIIQVENICEGGDQDE